MKDKRILNKEQKEAVLYGDGPLLIIAGAGTGKTTVITKRITHLLLEKHVLPSQILALTFTEKSAQEMEERIDLSLPYGYTQMWIATFHAFCDRVLRTHAIHIGLNPSYTLTTETESIIFLRKNIFKLHLDYFRPLGNPNKFLQGLLQHFSRLKDEDISPNEYINWAESQNDIDKELANAYKTYEDIKAKEDVMDFSDLIANTLKLFRTRENVLKTYQEQFKYILVDEFQDTNFAQNQLAILLAGKNKNITVVGDDDQAIYRWRGAAISNIIQFRKTFPKAKVIALTKNYRSTKEILNKSYQLIQHNNPDRLEVTEQINKKLTSERNKQGEEIEFFLANRADDEAEHVTKKITELVTTYRYSDIAILVRANDHAQPFIRSLTRAGIPFQFLGPGQLFQQEEIKDLIAYLKVLVNFEDSSSLYRILTMPIYSITPRDIATILINAKKKNISLFESLEQANLLQLEADTKIKIKKIIDTIKNHLGKMSQETAGQILYYFLQDSGILQNLLKIQNEKNETQAKNIAKFFDKLKNYEAEHKDASVFAIIEWIDVAMQMGESPLAADNDLFENNTVNILTLHASKGLEFGCVFLVNLISGRFPTRERKEQIPVPQDLIKEILPTGDFHTQEERRLFYVGMTRAKDNLFLTAAKYYGEGKRERKISPFVYETLDELLINKIIKTNSQLPLLEWAKTPSSNIKQQTNNKQQTTYLSYSQIQTFEVCPLHYKLKYILKIPTRQSPAQSFGTSLHSALRDFYSVLLTGEKISIADAPKLLNNVWISEGYDSREHEKEAKEKAIKILTMYLEKNYTPKSKVPLALELSFLFPLNGELKVGGRIDRIDGLENGKIEIIDYKTGTNTPKEKELATNEQLTLYALAAAEIQDPKLNKKPEDILLSLYYLETEEKFTTTRTKEQLEEAKTWILAKKEEIESSDFLCSKSILCKNCEYKMLCH